MKNYIIICVVFFFQFLLPLSLIAQTLEDELRIKEVKTVAEFMRRFNNKNIFQGYMSMQGDSVQLKKLLATIYGKPNPNRQEVLATVFCRDSLVKMNHNLLRDFLGQVTNSLSPINLSLSDNNWYAELTCRILYKGKEATLLLTMRREIDNPTTQAASWVAVGCYSYLFSVKPQKPSYKGVNPASNETNFLALTPIFRDKDNTENLTSKNFVYSNLSTLLYAVKNGDVEFKEVRKIRYHFLQVPNWVFVVENYARNTTNSGWLISTLEKKSEAEKVIYKQKKLFIESN